VINTSYYLSSNPFSFYNVTTAPIYINDTFVGNYSDFLTHISWSDAVNGTLYLSSNPYGFYNSTHPQTETDPLAYNGTLMFVSDWNATNLSYVPYTGASSNLDLGNNNLSVGTSDLFVNSNSGNVGIGTTTPDFKLQVDGDIAPETDSNSSIGSSLKRWLKGWFTDLNVENDLTVAGDIVVDGYVYSAQCPEGMAYIGNVGGYCIDKYEASMPSANSTDMGNSTEIALRNAPGTMEAQSVVGVVPWVQVSQISARIACENAGKRLCTDEEWLGASNVQGDTFNLPSDLAVAPYGCVTGASTYCLDHSYASGDACNTGYNVSGVSGCYSSEGVYDMVGNVWEWTNESVDVVSPDAGWKYVDSGDLSWSTSSADDDGTYGKDGVYIPVTTSGRAVLRGGTWSDGATAGPFCAHLAFAPTNAFSTIGFRCCSS